MSSEVEIQFGPTNRMTPNPVRDFTMIQHGTVFSRICHTSRVLRGASDVLTHLARCTLARVRALD